MFDDPKKELRRLQEELLAAEEEEVYEEEPDYDWEPDLDDELADIKALLNNGANTRQEPAYRNYANNYGETSGQFANGYRNFSQELLDEEDDDPSALYMDDYRTSRKKPKEKGIRGLVILACLETLGILAILGWWVIWLL